MICWFTDVVSFKRITLNVRFSPRLYSSLVSPEMSIEYSCADANANVRIRIPTTKDNFPLILGLWRDSI